MYANVFIIKRNLETTIVRMPIENGRLADTIPRASYDFTEDEFTVKRGDNTTITYNGDSIFLNDADYIEIAGHIINVKSTIHFNANSSDIINGWNLLKRRIDITKLFKFFFILEIQDLNRFYIEMTIKGSALKGEESRIVILVRLIYWYYQCSRIPSIKQKEKDIHDKLRLTNTLIEKAKEYGIGIEIVKQALRQINTTISELMIIALIKETNSKIVSFQKNYEFLIANKIAEVKTITPELEYIHPIQNIECTTLEKLKTFLFAYICNPNIKNHLKKAIEVQNADVVFLNLTFSYESQLLKCLKELEELGINFSITETIDNINKFHSTNLVQLVIVFTAIGFEYSLFFITMGLPIKIVNNLKRLDF